MKHVYLIKILDIQFVCYANPTTICVLSPFAETNGKTQDSKPQDSLISKNSESEGSREIVRTHWPLE